MIHHTYLLIPVTLICSFSFMTAVGTGANALVVGFSNMRGYDMASTGLVPAIVSFLAVWLSFPLYGAFFFPEIRKPYYFPKINCSDLMQQNYSRSSINISDFFNDYEISELL